MQSFLTFLTWTGSVRTQHSGGPSTCIHQQRGCVVEKYHHLLQFIKTTENCLKSWEQNGCGVGQNIHLPLFFTALAQGNNKVIWLSVFAACPCYVPAGDVRETSINSAILSTNCSICGYEKVELFILAWKINMSLHLKPGAEIQTKLNGLIQPAELQLATQCFDSFFPSNHFIFLLLFPLL